MKTAIAFTALALLVTPVWAYHQDSNPDLKQSITNVHENHFPHVAGRVSNMCPISRAIPMCPRKAMGIPMARCSTTDL